jgi:hypothetical protein
VMRAPDPAAAVRALVERLPRDVPTPTSPSEAP